MRKYQTLAILLVISTFYLSVDKYFEYQDLHNEWVVIYGNENFFVESRVNLYKIRELLKNTDISVRAAVWNQFRVQIKEHPFPHASQLSIDECSIESIIGNLHSGILLQVRCSEAVEH
jgi:nuclear transport factor 2 (NTF2) superfamily protein